MPILKLKGLEVFQKSIHGSDDFSSNSDSDKVATCPLQKDLGQETFSQAI